ncbi:hypothetical protein DAPPUDRAFT_112279 [Daphnia pulex]|uniref:Uncharacterized protein n=1 Tax=Daphnia pulex TaxID=6669 RepID=E9HBI9_DAPPU|nr:hypothetical protein DAPPUDRAFT_112279 [Daphnia pulex]|eukprot:EFX70850.1 hypothetical protein DAPPUDRAFT_112279 [Daphnia pulex]
MASLDSQFIWSLELDNQLMELIEQFPCLYNRNDESFKLPRKRNDAIAEKGRILKCDIPKETENTKRTAVEEDHPSKKIIITTENTVWSSYGISLGQTLSNLNHKAACSLRHSIETIIFTELKEN